MCAHLYPEPGRSSIKHAQCSRSPGARHSHCLFYCKPLPLLHVLVTTSCVPQDSTGRTEHAHVTASTDDIKPPPGSSDPPPPTQPTPSQPAQPTPTQQPPAQPTPSQKPSTQPTPSQQPPAQPTPSQKPPEQTQPPAQPTPAQPPAQPPPTSQPEETEEEREEREDRERRERAQEYRTQKSIRGHVKTAYRNLQQANRVVTRFKVSQWDCYRHACYYGAGLTCRVPI